MLRGTLLLTFALTLPAKNAVITPEGATDPALTTATDLSIQAGPVILSLQRTMTGPGGRAGLLGTRWRLSCEDWQSLSRFRLQRDGSDKITGIEGPAGAWVRFTLDAAGRLARAEASTGAHVVYSYGGGELSAVSINGGPTVRYGYDSSGRLARLEHPRAGLTEITWTGQGRVAAVRFGDGATERAEYDDAARVTRIISAAGGVTVYRWSPDRRRMEVTDPAGAVSVIEYDGLQRLIAVTGPGGQRAGLTYDAEGRPALVESPVGKITYQYGAGGRVEVLGINGARQTFEYDDAGRLAGIRLGGGLVASYRYTSDGQLAGARDGASLEQSYTYYPDGRLRSIANPLGEVAKYRYDARGNLITETNAANGTWSRAYDAQDRLVSITEPWGAVTRYEYDAAGRLVRMIEASGAVREYQYDACGRRISETDSLGNLTRFQYDPAGRLSRVSSPFGSATFSYDAVGRLVEEGGSMGASLRRIYDAAGRLTGERRPEGLEINYRRDAAGRLAVREDSAGHKLQWQYDAQSRPIVETDALGAATRVDYDPFGRVVSETDPLGRTREIGRAYNGDILAAVEATGDQAGFSYDRAGRLKTVLRPNGSQATYTYDILGNLVSARDPLGRESRRTHDVASRLIASTDAMGRTTRYSYDTMSRVSGKFLASGKQVAYRYDAAGRLIEANDGVFSVRHTYNAADSVTRTEYPAIRQAVQCQYNADGLRTVLTDPSGRAVRYEYGPTKFLSAIVLPDGRRIGTTRDVAGRLSSVVWPNGITGTWEFDAGGRLIAVRHRDRQGNDVVAATYTYSAAGEPVTRSTVQATTRFTYDAASQLTSETSAGVSRRYTYGRGGNRASAEIDGRSLSYRFDAADQMLEAGEEKFDYDANGNLIRRTTPRGVTDYSYDEENRLVRVAGPGGVTEYGYGPTGERVWRKTPDGAIRHFVYDGPNLLAELDAAMQPVALYVHAPGIDRPLAMIRGGETYFYHADRLGTIMGLSDSSGRLVASYRYDAFGLPLGESNQVVPNPFRFTGREWEPVGLYYFRARYYDPSLGRFLSPDTRTPRRDQPLDLNPYLYARNNPVRYFDPSGRDAEPMFDPRHPSLRDQSTEFLRFYFKRHGWILQAAADGELTLAPGGSWEEAFSWVKHLGEAKVELERRGVRVPASTPYQSAIEPPAPRSGTISQPADAPSSGAPAGESRGPGRSGTNAVDVGEALGSSRWGNTGRVEAGSPGGATGWGNTGAAGASAQPASPGAGPAQAPPRPMMGGDTVAGGVRPQGNTIRGPALESTGNSGTSARQILGAAGIMAGLDAVKVYACMQEGRSFAECSVPAAIGTAMGLAGAGLAAVAPAVAPAVVALGVGAATVGTGKEIIRANEERNRRDQAIAEANRAEKDVRIGQKVNLLDIEGRLAALQARIAGFQAKVDELRNQADTARFALEAAGTAAGNVTMHLTMIRQLDLKELLNSCSGMRQSQQLVAMNLAEARRRSALLARGLDHLRSVASMCTGSNPAGTVRQGLEDAKGLAAEIARLHSEAGKANRQLKGEIALLQKRQEDIKVALSTVNAASKWVEEAQNKLTAVKAAAAAGKTAANGLSPGTAGSLEVEVTALRGSVPDTLPAELEARFTTLRQSARNIRVPTDVDFDRMVRQAETHVARARSDAAEAQALMAPMCAPGTAQDKAVADLQAEIYGAGIELGAAQNYVQIASRCGGGAGPGPVPNTAAGGSSNSTPSRPTGNTTAASSSTPVCELRVSTDRTSGYYGESVLVTVTAARGADLQLTVARACDVPGCGAPILRHAGGGVYYDRLEFGLSASKYRQAYVAVSRDGRARCEATTPELQSLGVRR